MSIERLEGSKYDFSADIWSVAVSLIEIWNGKYPFNSYETPIHLHEEIQEVNLLNIIDCSRLKPSNHMLDFFMDSMVKSYKKRCKASDLISSPWFKSFKISCLEDAQHIIYHFLHNSTKWYKNRDIFNYIGGNRKFIPTTNSYNNLNMSINFGGYDNKLPLSTSTAIMRDVFESSMDKFNMSLNKSVVNNPFLSSFTSRDMHNDMKKTLDDDAFDNVKREHIDEDYYDDFER